MCNYFRHKKYGLRDWTEDFSQLRVPLKFPDPLPNIRDAVRPTDPTPIFRPIDAAKPTDGLETAVIRWDLVPPFWVQPIKAKKFLATNARSETVATQAAFKGAFSRRRCLVPADAFYEWTGEKGAKTMWEITVPSQPWFAFAGLWDLAVTADGPVESCTILTSAAGDEMAPYHSRQPVILPRDGWMRWLDLSADPTPLFAPGPSGTLSVAQADQDSQRLWREA
jgi:putative SOS response-associated peptidase YedK